MASRYKSIPFIVLFAPLASCLAIVEGDNSTQKAVSGDIFDNLEKMSKVNCDVIFVHGSEDKVIPPMHSNVLFNRYMETHTDTNNNIWLLEVENADHNQLIFALQDSTLEYRHMFLHNFYSLLDNNHIKLKMMEEWLKSITFKKRVPGAMSISLTTKKEGSDKSDDIPLEIIELSKSQSLPEPKEKEEEKKTNEQTKKKDKSDANEARKYELQETERIIKEETQKLKEIFAELVVNKRISKPKEKKEDDVDKDTISNSTTEPDGLPM